MKKIQKVLTKYALTVFAAGALSVLTIWLREYSPALDAAEKYRILADAFTIPGVILVMLAALVWISTDGFFDGIGYSMLFLKDALLPGGAKAKRETYHDYKMRKRGERVAGYGNLFFVGLAFIAVAVVFVALYTSV